MIAPEPPWSIRIALGDLGRGPVTLDLTPEAATERAIAKALRLVDLKGLSAKVRLSAWLDGVELNGEWAAVVTQVCGVSLDPFDTELAGVFQVRCAPLGSPLLSPPESELEIDLEADDPPDALEHDWVDVAAYVVEHLALAVDPFPRKPGAEFTPPPPETPPSPFAVLARLQPAPRTSSIDSTADDVGSGE
jgi:hypothetical protein